LEAIYALGDEGRDVIAARLAEHLSVSAPTVTEALRRLVKEGYITVSQRREIEFTTEGRVIAEQIVRRHRLTERLLTDLLGVPWYDVHEEASRLEHAISPSVEAKLAALLGEPATCPHGNPIPGSGKPNLETGYYLDAAGEGDELVVERITEQAEQDSRLLEYLHRNGIVPGARVAVANIAQSTGAIELHVGYQIVGISLQAANWIFVQPAE
jgi:DtxR family Mn-dependent transcriptional regulator